jgi:cell division protein FtsI (penicillin-binding protein 3)
MPQRVVSTDTSAKIRDLMRRNVVVGTGKRAEVPGYEVGGKTGTAELAVKGGYAQKSVIASFLAAFPMRAPRYLVFVMLNEPAPTSDTAGQITAGLNAAPIAGRIIARVAPIMGVPPVDADPG